MPPDHPTLQRRSALGVIAAAGLALAGCSGGSGTAARGGGSGQEPVVLATGTADSGYTGYGKALAAQLDTTATGMPARTLLTGGSVDNLLLLSEGRATAAFCSADTASAAFQGNSPFTRPLPLRAIASLYDDYLHLVVRADTALTDLAQLRHRRVGTGPPGSGTAFMAGRVLEAARLPVSARPLGLTDSVEALRAGRIDAFFWAGPVPTPAIADLAVGTPIRLLPLDRLGPALRSRYGAAYRTAAIQADTYARVLDVTALAVPALLTTTAGTRDSVVHGIVQVLFAARARVARTVPEAAYLDARSAIFTQPIPLHPAAVRFYHSAKP